MAAKLYVDGLRLLANKSYKYSTRYQASLQANLTADQYAALVDFITCVGVLVVKLGKNLIVP